MSRKNSFCCGYGRSISRGVFLFAVPLLLGFFAAPAFAQRGTIRFVRNPDPAPEFQLNTLEGKPLSLGEYKGKVILLNFWATWCGPCRAEIPDLIELQNKYRDQFQIIGLVVDDDDEKAVKKFVADSDINYPVALASDEVRLEYGGVVALPTSFVLDAAGRVVQKHEGLRDPVLFDVEVRSLLGLPIGDVKVETFEDTGQIFLKHADRATQLPGVDISKLTPAQRTVALHKFNAESCTCGCGYTLAQCRIWDRNCGVSKAATEKIVADLSGASRESADPPAAAKSPSSASPASSKKPSAPEKPRR
ncbi:MAG TPA: TlpA disulfide reductase family protein [Candidatus Acidoferrum sp.]|nr:TlpA disulfide reductase family protein [Candidatus Acidoferrum sp.]